MSWFRNGVWALKGYKEYTAGNKTGINSNPQYLLSDSLLYHVCVTFSALEIEVQEALFYFHKLLTI